MALVLPLSFCHDRPTRIPPWSENRYRFWELSFLLAADREREVSKSINHNPTEAKGRLEWGTQHLLPGKDEKALEGLRALAFLRPSYAFGERGAPGPYLKPVVVRRAGLYRSMSR